MFDHVCFGCCSRDCRVLSRCLLIWSDNGSLLLQFNCGFCCYLFYNLVLVSCVLWNNFIIDQLLTAFIIKAVLFTAFFIPFDSRSILPLNFWFYQKHIILFSVFLLLSFLIIPFLFRFPFFLLSFNSVAEYQKILKICFCLVTISFYCKFFKFFYFYFIFNTNNIKKIIWYKYI